MEQGSLKVSGSRGVYFRSSMGQIYVNCILAQSLKYLISTVPKLILYTKKKMLHITK